MIQIPHLETLVHMNCGNSCTACNNFVPVHRGKRIIYSTPEGVERDLKHLSTILHTPLYGALGGEPTGHPQIVDILNVMKRSGIADRIECWSHGQTIQRQPPEFWEALDILVVSVYPGKHTEESLGWITEKCRSEGRELVWKDERVMQNFRTCLEPKPDTDAAYTRRKYQSCWFRTYCRSVTMGYFFMCCTSPSIPSLFQDRSFGTDGVPILGLTEDALRAYLDRTEPLGACTICAGRETAKPMVWREEKDPVKWVERSKGL